MNVRLAVLAVVLIAAVGRISSLVSSVGVAHPLADDVMLDDLERIYPKVLKEGHSVSVGHDTMKFVHKYLITRGIVPYPILAPNVAYVPAIGTNCMDYGDYSVFVDVHRGLITAVVDQSHCISLHCEQPSQNKQLDLMIQIITLTEIYNFAMAQLPNLGPLL